jgi:nitrate reductase NapAB chaperone NapD
LILVEREKHLPAIVQSLLETSDRQVFKELLLACAAHRDSAWAVCGLLAQAYPERASAIAQVALQFSRKSV